MFLLLLLHSWISFESCQDFVHKLSTWFWVGHELPASPILLWRPPGNMHTCCFDYMTSGIQRIWINDRMAFFPLIWFGIIVKHCSRVFMYAIAPCICSEQWLKILRPALPEKPTLLEIIRNDLCSYSGSDIPRVSYFISWDEITLYRCLSGQLSRFSIFCIVHGFWSSGTFALNMGTLLCKNIHTTSHIAVLWIRTLNTTSYLMRGSQVQTRFFVHIWWGKAGEM